MSSKQLATDGSSDDQAQETALGTFVDGELPTADVEAAAQRAADYIRDRRFGAHTSQLVGYIAMQAAETADLNLVITEQLSTRLHQAKTVEDILTPFDPNSGEAYIGKPICIVEAMFLESDFSEGFPYYCSLRITQPGVEGAEVITIGGEKLVLQVGAAHMNDLLPMVCKIHRVEKATGKGFHPLELRPV